MKREDLRWKSAAVDDPPGLLVSDAELAELIESMGYVKRPACGTCEDGLICVGPPHEHDDGCRCPSCGGSGFEAGVFVSRSQLESWLADSDKQYDLEASFEYLLAAIDQEAT